MNIICWVENKQNTHNSDGSPFTVSADFHFNYWPKSISDHKQKTSYLDIGVMLHSYKNLSNLCFWFPNGTSDNLSWQENINDLGKLLNDATLASLIFNRSVKVSNGAIPKQLEIEKADNSSPFIVYQLSSENISFSNQYDGTILIIDLSNAIKDSNDKPIYVRFRLKGDFLSAIARVINVKNKLFQSAFTETSYIDFRFNDVRSMSASMQEHFQHHPGLLIQKVHFLLMTRSDEELTSPDNITARILEPKLWESYIGHDICDVCVANHWKFVPEDNKNSLESCIIYARYKVQHCNFTTIALYLLILFLLTVTFNVFSSFLYSYLQTWFPLIFK